MRSVPRLLVSGVAVLLGLSTAAGQDFSKELQRGRDLLNDLAKRPPAARQVFAEVTLADQVIGYGHIRLEPDKGNQLRGTIDIGMQMPGMRLTGTVEAETDLKLQPRRVELRRHAEQPDGKAMTQQWTANVKNGSIEATVAAGDGRRTRTLPLPDEPFLFCVDLLAARSDIGRQTQPFALWELDPQAGEPRLLVFRPSTEQNGTRVINVLIDGQTPEATYRFSKDGKLLAWSEANAPIVMKVVDEQRGRALIKQFGRPQSTQPASKAE